MVDLYHAERDIKLTKEKFKTLCENCFTIVEGFERTLKLANYSNTRILKYWYSLKNSHNMLGACFDKAKKVDMENLVITVNARKDWKEWTKSDTKKMIKIFYRWFVNSSLKGDYPDIVKWISPKIKVSGLTHEQILSQKEVEMMANETNDPRDRALVLVLYDSGCRIGEILNLKLKDVQPDEFGCVISVTGKTGPRKVRLIDYHNDFYKWLDAHPNKDPESYVFVNGYDNSSIITEARVNAILKKLAKKAGITKRVYPHLMRHSRATFFGGNVPDAVSKKIFGWAKDSRMASVYQHLSNKDVDDALLKLKGLKPEDLTGEGAGTKACPKCATVNPAYISFCRNRDCSFPLNSKAIIEFDNKMQRFDELIRDFFEYYAQKDGKFKQMLKDFVKERKYGELFTIPNDS